jgi:hypothetical protein
MRMKENRAVIMTSLRMMMTTSRKMKEKMEKDLLKAGNEFAWTKMAKRVLLKANDKLERAYRRFLAVMTGKPPCPLYPILHKLTK